MITKGFKYRIYPDKEQQEQWNKNKDLEKIHFGFFHLTYTPSFSTSKSIQIFVCGTIW